MPRPPLGSDDEFVVGSDDEAVVKVAWEVPEEAERNREPVSRVFDGATAVLRKEPNALRLTMDQKRRLEQRYELRFDHIVVWGDPEF